jgi:CHAD domain-containing protein
MKSATEKWVTGTSPGEPVSTVAARTLQGRLGAVLHYLPLAAEKADEDLEYVHQLRVWVRRASAALSLYQDLLPRRRSCWMRKQLKRVRRAANNARDCDVLLERLKKKPRDRQTEHWLQTVRAERARAQKAIVAVHERLGRDGLFARRIDKLVQRVRDRGDGKASATPPAFEDWAREHLGQVVERFFRDIPADSSDETALHQLRIHGKELRYTLELLAGAFPKRLQTELYPVIEEMQDRLGEINDLATAKARLQHQIETTGDRSEVASWRRLLANEQRQLDHARQAFWDWWAPGTLHDLRAGFDAILTRPVPAFATRHGEPACACL